MTPAIKLLDRQKIDYQLLEYVSDSEAGGYGEAAASALGQDPHRVFKTLLAVVDGNERQPVVAIVAVAHQLDLKKLALAHGGRKAAMATTTLAERTTGYVVGGISPLGQRKQLPTMLDRSALEYETIHISGGRRGLEIEINPHDLVKLTSAKLEDIART